MSSVIRGSDNFDTSPVKSMIRVNTTNGYGSTNTMIRRFSNIVTSQGSDITFADSATLGSSFTINTAGVYAMSASDNYNAGGTFGITLDSAQLTTAFNSITGPSRLCSATPSANGFSGTVATTLYLPAGSVLRLHAGAQASGTTGDVPNQFTIVRVA